MENGNGHHRTFAFDEFRLETELQSLRRGTDEIHIAKRPYQVLNFLIENRERLVTRDELLDKFWDGHDVYDDALRKCVGAIRKALGDVDNPSQFIEIRRGSGYRFIAEVSEERTGRELARQPRQLFDIPVNGIRSEISPVNFEVDRRVRMEPRALVASLRIPTAILGVVLLSIGAFGYFAFIRNPLGPTVNTLAGTVAQRRSIAILPIKNLTGDAANDYLSDGITEGLINDVSRIENLKVISRSSAFQFKDNNASAQEIGDRLGVETILEGGLRKSGDELRVETRLVSTKDGSVLWASDSRQKKMADIFVIEDGITCQIVTELKVRLCGEMPPASRYTQNVSAYQAYLKGLYLRNKPSKENLDKAVEYFNEALKIDPNYALAHDGLASTYAVMELNGVVPPGSAAPLAELHANEALKLDDSLAGAYLALGVVKTLNNYDLAERENYYRQAIQKNANHRTAHLWLSDIFLARGEFEQAEAEVLKVQEIDPLSAGVHFTLADIYFYWRKPDKVIDKAELMLAASPNDQQAFVWLALSYAQKGDFEKAFGYMEKLPPEDNNRITVLAAAGRTDEARKLTQAFANSAEAKRRPYEVAEAYAVIGDKEAAFEWLEKSYQVRQANLISIKIDPLLDPLRDDPRYAAIVGRVGLSL